VREIRQPLLALFAGVAILLLILALGVTCLLACWVPARKALASSPMEALRAE